MRLTRWWTEDYAANEEGKGGRGELRLALRVKRTESYANKGGTAEAMVSASRSCLYEQLGFLGVSSSRAGGLV